MFGERSEKLGNVWAVILVPHVPNSVASRGSEHWLLSKFDPVNLRCSAVNLELKFERTVNLIKCGKSVRQARFGQLNLLRHKYRRLDTVSTIEIKIGE